MERRHFIAALAGMLLLPWRGNAARADAAGAPGGGMKTAEKIVLYSVRTSSTYEADRVVRTEGEWRKILTAEQFAITRRKGTEPAFNNKYHQFKGKGIYTCADCGTELFSSAAKYDSGTGWPSFWEPVSAHNIRTESDRSWFMERVEVLCARCDAHLGHVFDDGPRPTGKRYCMNSAALAFVPAQK